MFKFLFFVCFHTGSVTRGVPHLGGVFHLSYDLTTLKVVGAKLFREFHPIEPQVSIFWFLGKKFLHSLFGVFALWFLLLLGFV